MARKKVKIKFKTKPITLSPEAQDVMGIQEAGEATFREWEECAAASLRDCGFPVKKRRRK